MKEIKFVDVDEKNLDRTLNQLKLKGIYRISSISGVDLGKFFEIIYHFDFEGKLVNIKIKISKKTPEIKTITKHFPGAELFERELSEMFGIKIKDHPDSRKLFLDENSPETPLRKKWLNDW